MKIPILCCIALSLICVCFGQLKPNSPIINQSILRLMNRGVNQLAPNRLARPIGPVVGPPRIVQFLPVPVVKKVTHHHVHHVIAHKGVIKSKYSSDNDNDKALDLDNKDSDNDNDKSKDDGWTFKSYKEETGSNTDFDDNGYKSVFSKRGGRPQANNSVATLADLIKSTGGGKSSIRGIIGGQKAEFLPIVIGILNDDQNGSKDNEFSKRKSLIRPDKKNRYLPPKETIKMFEDLARMGFKK